MYSHRAQILRRFTLALLHALTGAACIPSTHPSEDNWDTSGTTPTTETGATSDSTADETTEPPLECNNDGVCDPGETEQNCRADCVVPPGCGDGTKNGDEACDDGEHNGEYGKCKADCSGTTSCGDGKQNGPEKCDDGPDNNNDYSAGPHCNADCSALAPHCGDNTCDPEQKEDGNSCTMDCKPGCGNGIKEPGEACDEGMADTPTCDADCTAVECGDMHVNTALGEACDDGNTATDDACIMCQAAICGDGFVQKEVEACDDSNDINDDACSNACQPPRRVFITSIGFTGKLFGLAGADQKCQAQADTAELNGTFLAWLSDDTGSPSTRFDTAFTGSYQLLDGTVIASDGWMDLIDGTLAHAIDLDEKLKDTDLNVWTNTLLDGTPASTSDHCNNWSTGGNTTTVVGDTKAVDKTWTELLVGQFCKDPRRLFCFENP